MSKHLQEKIGFDQMPTPVAEKNKILKYASEIDKNYLEKHEKLKDFVRKNKEKLGNNIVIGAYNRLKNGINVDLNLKQINEKNKYSGMKWITRKGNEKVTFLRDYNDVLALQVLFKKLNYSIKLTSKFDDQTVNIIKIFQKGMHLKVDGEFGPQTLNALKKMLSKYGNVDFTKTKESNDIKMYDHDFKQKTVSVDVKYKKNKHLNNKEIHNKITFKAESKKIKSTTEQITDKTEIYIPELVPDHLLPQNLRGKKFYYKKPSGSIFTDINRNDYMLTANGILIGLDSNGTISKVLKNGGDFDNDFVSYKEWKKILKSKRLEKERLHNIEHVNNLKIKDIRLENNTIILVPENHESVIKKYRIEFPYGENGNRRIFLKKSDKYQENKGIELNYYAFDGLKNRNLNNVNPKDDKAMLIFSTVLKFDKIGNKPTYYNFNKRFTLKIDDKNGIISILEKSN